MAIVPPGNKQFGEYTGIAVISSFGASLMYTGGEVHATMYDQSTTAAPIPPSNIMLGEYTCIGVIGGTSPAISLTGMESHVIVTDATPAEAKYLGSELHAVLEDPLMTAEPVPVLNVQLGEYTGVVTIGARQTSMSLLGMDLHAIVQLTTPRLETVIMNLVYPGGG